MAIDLNALCQECIEEIKKLNIPYHQPTKVVWDRAIRRWGCCHYRSGTYWISLSSRLNNPKIPRQILKEVMMHEVLHTSTKKHNHDAEWDRYAALVNKQYGYKIQRLVRKDFMDTVQKIIPHVYKYILTCRKCGATWRRDKASRFVKEYKNYTCHCGGKISRTTN